MSGAPAPSYSHSSPLTLCLPFIKVAQENHNGGCAHAPHLFNGKEALADERGVASLSALGVVIAHALRREIRTAQKQ